MSSLSRLAKFDVRVNVKNDGERQFLSARMAAQLPRKGNGKKG